METGAAGIFEIGPTRDAGVGHAKVMGVLVTAKCPTIFLRLFNRGH
jgi:hypothetical protein